MKKLGSERLDVKESTESMKGSVHMERWEMVNGDNTHQVYTSTNAAPVLLYIECSHTTHQVLCQH